MVPASRVSASRWFLRGAASPRLPIVHQRIWPAAKRLCGCFVLILLCVPACERVQTDVVDENPERHEAITFSNDVAHIIFRKCTPCHREQGSAPFGFESYQQVAKRAEQIAEVVASGYMPPWLPSGDYEFVGDRRLSEDQVDLVTRWAKDGATRGNPTDQPPPPSFAGEWLLGAPDLILEMPEAYLHLTSDTDEWRNFVLPLHLPQKTYVRAFDVRSDNPQAIHHAVIQVDRTGRARRLDELDTGPGFAGMQDGRLTLGPSSAPSGQVLGWLPGKAPYPGDDDLAWPAYPGDDVVLQLHMPATGKDELVNARIAFYFADAAPKKQPVSILLSLRDIDIPAGEAAYTRELAYTLPVDVSLRGLFPHAHYICEEMLVTAELPSGQTKQLLHIPQWDFNWQDDYRFSVPAILAKGTTIKMRFRYNNSESNIQNPFSPPRQIVYGEESTDSMGDLILQVVPGSLEERNLLTQDFRRFQYEQSLARWLSRIDSEPNNPRHHVTAGEALMLLGRVEEAVSYFSRATELGDRDARTAAKLAACWKQLGKPAAAIEHQQRAVEMAPDQIAFRSELALMLLATGQLIKAEEQYQELLVRHPEHAQANSNLGMILGRSGRLSEAEHLLRTAIRVEPDFAPAHVNLGIVLRQQQRYDEAITHFERAVQLDSANTNARNLLEQTRKLNLSVN